MLRHGGTDKRIVANGFFVESVLVGHVLAVVVLYRMRVGIRNRDAPVRFWRIGLFGREQQLGGLGMSPLLAMIKLPKPGMLLPQG